MEKTIKNYSKSMLSKTFQSLGRWITFLFFKILHLRNKIFRLILSLSLGILSFAALLIISFFVFEGNRDFPALEASSFFQAIAGTTAMLLGVAYAFAILTIQRSSEQFGSWINHLYKKDKTSSLVPIVLGGISLFAYACSLNINLVTKRNYILVYANIFSLGVTFDLIRYFNKHVTDLINPLSGLRTAQKFIRGLIDKNETYIAVTAKIQFFFLCSNERGIINLLEAQRKQLPSGRR